MPGSWALFHSTLRKREGYRGPGSGFVRTDIDCTTMSLDNRLGKEQPETDPFALGGEKGLEDMICHFGVDSGPGVTESDHETIVVLAERHPHRSPLGHRLHSVGDHVHATRADFLRIDIENGRNAIRVFDDLDS